MDETQEISPIEQLRNEFQEQFSALKTSFEESTREKDEHIAQLKSHNQELERALIRSAVHEAPAPSKTEEQIYSEKITSLANKTLNMMKSR